MESGPPPPPEDYSQSPFRYLPSETAPSFSNLESSDQSIEWAFSRMSLSNNFQSVVQTPSSDRFSDSVGTFAAPEIVPWGGDSGGNQQLPPRVYNGLVGSYMARSSGPGTLGSFGRGRYLDAGFYPLELTLSEQIQGLSGVNSENNGYSFLHDKKPLSVTANGYFPDSPSVRQSNNGFLTRGPFYRSHRYYRPLTPVSFSSLRGNIVRLAKDQLSSVNLISRLEDGVSEDEIGIILPEILESLVDLLMDQFGNGFVQILFARCTEDQKTLIIMALTQFQYEFFSVCINQFGCRAVNQLFDMFLTPQQISLVVSALIPIAIALATHENGHRVVQHCIKGFPAEYNTGLFNVLASECFRIATDQSGCVVLQDCIDNSRGTTRHHLIREILSNALPLAEHHFGNYVVQRLIYSKIPNAITSLFKQFRGNFMHFSRNKFASNVVEKFLKEMSETPYAEAIIRELICSPDASSLLVDPYGNYVIQTAMSVSKGHIQNALIQFIEENSASMQSSMFGKKILVSLEKKKMNIR